MTMRLKLATLLLPVGAAGCGSPASVQHTNEATTQQLDVISNNTGETDGQSAAASPPTSDGLGQRLRAGAASKPKPR